MFGLYSDEAPSQLAQFVKQTGISFPIKQDSAGTLSNLEFPPGVGYPYPRDVIIDKKLQIRSIRNSFSAEETEKLVEQLLKE